MKGTGENIVSSHLPSHQPRRRPTQPVPWSVIRRRAHRTLRWLIATVIAFLLVLAATTVYLYAPEGLDDPWRRGEPITKTVRPADAVFVIAGSSDGRHELGAALVRAGVAKNFVVSNPRGPADHTGWEYCHRENKHTPGADKIICLTPDPVTTRGEARTINDLAESYGWQRIIVVTNRPHTHRVRLIYQACTPLDVQVLHIKGIHVGLAPYHVLREVLGTAKFLIQRPCA